MANSILTLGPDARPAESEQRERSATHHGETVRPTVPQEPQRVVIFDFDMRFGSMLKLALKGGLASLLAAAIIGSLLALVYVAGIQILGWGRL